MPWKPTIKHRGGVTPLPRSARVDRLVDHIRAAGYKEEQLILHRGLAYGAAAACFVLLVTLTQVGITSIALRISIYAASVGLPLWILHAAIYDAFTLLGAQAYPLYSVPICQRLVTTLFLAASLSLFIATTSVIAHLAIEAAWVFVIACAVAVTLYIAFIGLAGAWWVTRGPKSS